MEFTQFGSSKNRRRDYDNDDEDGPAAGGAGNNNDWRGIKDSVAADNKRRQFERRFPGERAKHDEDEAASYHENRTATTRTSAANDDFDDNMSRMVGRPVDIKESADGKIVRAKGQKPWETPVVDAQGRPRFHGAFTGGFSAGYFNSVGSAEGWAPQQFRSSRTKRAERPAARPEDFMDSEDLGEAATAGTTMKARDEFEGSSTITKAADDKLLQTLIVPKKMPVGLQLLKTMGYREGDAVGTSIETIERNKAKAAYMNAAAASSSASRPTHTHGATMPPSIQATLDDHHDDDDDAADATIDWESITDPDEQQAAKEKWMAQLAGRAGRTGGAAGLASSLAPKGRTTKSTAASARTELYETTKKDDLFGIGFDMSAVNSEITQHRDTLLRLEKPSAAGDDSGPHQQRGRMAMDSFGKGNARFGMGALEDNDGADDPYSSSGMEQYDIEIGGRSKKSAHRSTNHDQSYATISFVPAESPPPPIVTFKPVVVPADWQPIHRFTHDSVVLSNDLVSLLRSSDSAQYAATLGIGNMRSGGTGGLSADQRGSMLGERVLPSQTARGMQNIASAPGIGADTTLAPTPPPQPQLANSVFDMMSTADRQRLSLSLTNTFAVASAQAMAVGTTRPGFRAMVSPDDVARDNYATDPDKSARFVGYVAARIVEAKNALATKQSANTGKPPVLVAADHRYARLSGNMTDFQRSREKEEFEALMTQHQLMPTSLTSQAVAASPVVAAKKPAVLDFEGAAKMKMYGRLTRTEVNWKPDKLLCKRFNVIDPWIDRDFTETITGDAHKVMSDTQQRNQLLEQTIQASHGRALMAGMSQASTQQPSVFASSSSSSLSRADKSSSGSTMNALEAVLKDEGSTDVAAIADLAPPPKPAVDLFKAIFEADDEEEEKERLTALAARAAREAQEAAEEEEELKRLSSIQLKTETTSSAATPTPTPTAPSVKSEAKRSDTNEEWSQHDSERNTLMSSLQTQIQQARDRAREIEAKFHRSVVPASIPTPSTSVGVAAPSMPMMSPSAAAAALGGLGLGIGMMSQFNMSTLGALASSMAGSLPPPPPPPSYTMKPEPRSHDTTSAISGSSNRYSRSDTDRSRDRDSSGSNRRYDDDNRSNDRHRSSRHDHRSNSNDRHRRRRSRSRSNSRDRHSSRRNDRHIYGSDSLSSTKAKAEEDGDSSHAHPPSSMVSMSALESKSEQLRQLIANEKKLAATRAAADITNRLALNNTSTTSTLPATSAAITTLAPPAAAATPTDTTSDAGVVLTDSLLKTLAKLHKQKEKKKKEKKSHHDKDKKKHDKAKDKEKKKKSGKDKQHKSSTK